MPVPQPVNDVPIWVETPARPSVPYVRCIYMAVESSDPSQGWELDINGQSVPFLMLGLTGIIQQPFGAPRFHSFNLIEDLFSRIESRADLLLVFDDLWLPPFLFPYHLQAGTAYRVQLNLFREAFRFRDGNLTRDDFESRCSELKTAIIPSPEETTPLNSWIAEQVSTATSKLKSPELALGFKNTKS